MKSHAQKVEPAMLMLMAWLIRGKYRVVMHRHTGCYRAADESTGEEWNADDIVGLVELMNGKELA